MPLLWYGGGGVACTQPETPAPTTYTITFDSGVESISVEEGAVAKEPSKPTKDGYEFIEWLNGTEAYDWALPVTSNLSLTAKWSAIKYTITYLPEGVKTDNPTNYTIESETITLKEPTLEEGKYFIAWHVDTEEGKVETEIAKGATGNKTFYAEISSEKPCVVTFNDGTKVLASVNTKKDSKVTLPTGYEKYNFFSDKECKKAFDITTPITADTTIYVKVKTFTVTVKMLPFEEEIKIPEIPYGTVFTDEDLDLDSDEGYEYKGIFTDEACTKTFDMTKPITSDLTIYVKYEKVEAPSENELEKIFEFDKTYSGYLEWDMVANGEWGNSTTRESITLNVNVKDVALKAKDKIVVEFKLTSTEGLQQIGYQSATNAYDWAAVTPNENNTYKVSWTIGEEASFENDLLGFFFTPQGIDGSLVGKKYKLNFESLKVTLVPYVAGEQKTEVLHTGAVEPYTTQLDVPALQQIYDNSTGDAEIIFSYKIISTDGLKTDGNYEWIANLTGWTYDENGEEKWADCVEVPGGKTVFDTQCAYAEIEVGKELTKSFALSELLPLVKDYHHLTINIFNGANTAFSDIKVVYTAK